MQSLKHKISIVFSLLGLGYIAWVTFTRPDAYFLLKTNVFVPFFIITLSLSFITFGMSKTFFVIKDLIQILLLNKVSKEPFFDEMALSISRYSYVSVILWILYSSIYTFGFEEISINRLISFSLIGILYAFTLSEILIRPAKTKNSLLNKERNA